MKESSGPYGSWTDDTRWLTQQEWCGIVLSAVQNSLVLATFIKQRKTTLKKALHKSLLVTKIRGYNSLDLNAHWADQKHQHCRDLHAEPIIPRFLTLFELR